MNTKQLIPVLNGNIAGESTPLVNARELHTYLAVATRFNDWMTTRISEYDFVENQDFISFTENSVKPAGGRPSKDYLLTLDMAKELSMVERNEKGKQARRYFIDCEKALNATKSSSPEQQSIEIKLSLTRLSLFPPKEVFWVTVDEWTAAVLTDNNKSGRQLNKSIVLGVGQDIRKRSEELSGYRTLEQENAMLHDKCALLEKAVHDNTKYVTVLEKYNALLEQGGVH